MSKSIFASRRHSDRAGQSIEASELALEACQGGLDQKARDLSAYDVRGVSSITDFVVVMSGTSERHVSGMADKIERRLRDRGERPISVSGGESAQWIVLDYGDLVVHISFEPTREYYDFDALWKKSTRIEFPPQMAKEAHALTTGMFR